MSYNTVYVLSNEEFKDDKLHLDGANGPLGYIDATQNFVNELQFLLKYGNANDFQSLKKELLELIENRKMFIEFAKDHCP